MKKIIPIILSVCLISISMFAFAANTQANKRETIKIRIKAAVTFPMDFSTTYTPKKGTWVRKPPETLTGTTKYTAKLREAADGEVNATIAYFSQNPTFTGCVLYITGHGRNITAQPVNGLNAECYVTSGNNPLGFVLHIQTP